MLQTCSPSCSWLATLLFFFFLPCTTRSARMRQLSAVEICVWTANGTCAFILTKRACPGHGSREHTACQQRATQTTNASTRTYVREGWGITDGESRLASRLNTVDAITPRITSRLKTCQQRFYVPGDNVDLWSVHRATQPPTSFALSCRYKNVIRFESSFATVGHETSMY